MVNRLLVPSALSMVQSVVLLLLLLSPTTLTVGQISPRTIHVFVALCDNEHQGIIPVPAKLGNGDDPQNNLYWGARYGVKTFFQRSNDWELLSSVKQPANEILERCIFKHRTRNVFLIADAYKGSEIKNTVIDFLEAASGNNPESIAVHLSSQNVFLPISGASDLVVYIGHNGLMDFQLDTSLRKNDRNTKKRDAIILACVSKSYFSDPLRKSGANPLLWTTGLMAPEAYTLKSTIDGWILNETGEQIRLRAAQAYSQYQKSSLRSARNLFVTGW